MFSVYMCFWNLTILKYSIILFKNVSQAPLSSTPCRTEDIGISRLKGVKHSLKSSIFPPWIKIYSLIAKDSLDRAFKHTNL
jgi:hypothetical protein